MELGRCPYREEDRFPILVWWTPTTYYKHMLRRCTYGRCMFTHNRREQLSDRTVGFLFSGPQFNESDLPLPRQPDQEWFLLHDDPPQEGLIFTHDQVISLFNRTATFRRQSDFPLTLQHLESLDTLAYSGYTSSVEDKNKARREKKLAPVMYMESVCDTPSNRDTLVKNLSKFIDIDVRGTCLHGQVGRKMELFTQGQDDLFLYSAYKFVLIIEEALCPDYIGHSLWHAMRFGVVPVYLGSPTVRDWLPHEKAAILVSDFPSLDSLAAHLKKLDQDDAAYRKHLLSGASISNKNLEKQISARNYGQLTNSLQTVGDGFECHVCDKVYERLLAKAEGKPLPHTSATAEQFGCADMHASGNTVLEGKWRGRASSAKRHAEALVAMLRSGESDSTQFDGFLKKALFKD